MAAVAAVVVIDLVGIGAANSNVVTDVTSTTTFVFAYWYFYLQACFTTPVFTSSFKIELSTRSATGQFAVNIWFILAITVSIDPLVLLSPFCTGAINLEQSLWKCPTLSYFQQAVDLALESYTFF